MKEITREWLNRANDDLCVIEEIIGNSKSDQYISIPRTAGCGKGFEGCH